MLRASLNFRQRISDFETLVGTFVLIPRLEIVELAALAGFDFVIIDCEHGAYGVESVLPLVTAAQARRIGCLVRVPDHRPQAIGVALDTGADGVIVPHIGSSDEAREIVEATRFGAGGKRGANPWVRAGAYGSEAQFYEEADRAVACIAMIEEPTNDEKVGTILDVPGLDAIFVGPVDLSVALGFAGQTDHPDVMSSVRRIVDRAHAHGLPTAIFAVNPGQAARWLAAGVTIVALSVDTGHVLTAFRDALSELKAEGAKRP